MTIPVDIDDVAVLISILDKLIGLEAFAEDDLAIVLALGDRLYDAIPEEYKEQPDQLELELEQPE